MNWIQLDQISQLDQIKDESTTEPILIFKHSTRCSISSAALNRLERNWNDQALPQKHYFLDLIAHRDISNKIAEIFNVEHQSPQILLIKDHKAIYHASHMQISTDGIQMSLK